MRRRVTRSLLKYVDRHYSLYIAVQVLSERNSETFLLVLRKPFNAE